MASGRTEYLNDPEAPKPNSLVPAAGVLAVDPGGRVLLQHHRDTGQCQWPRPAFLVSGAIAKLNST